MELFLSALASLFVIVDPLGTAAVFLALTKNFDAKAARSIALKAVTIAIALLTFFALFGEALLSHLGISFDAFRIAGGLLLFVTAFRMIMGFHDAGTVDSDKSCYKDEGNIAVFPLAIPMLAGPGCMTATVLNINLATNLLEKLGVIGAIILVELATLLCLLFASYVVKIIGNTGSSILARLMGILLAALSVQFIIEGITGALHN